MKKQILEEAKALLTEAIFNHRWELLLGYHAVGKLLVEHRISAKEAADVHSEKYMHYARELAKKYPDVNSVPDGKTVSWYKLCKTLPPYEADQTPKAKQARHRSYTKKNLG